MPTLTVFALAALGATSPARDSLIHQPSVSTRNVDVRVDKERHTLAVTIGPFHVPQSTAMMGDKMMMRQDHGTIEGAFAWPVTARFHGVKLEVIDSAGRALPRRLLHHTYMLTFDR